MDIDEKMNLNYRFASLWLALLASNAYTLRFMEHRRLAAVYSALMAFELLYMAWLLYMQARTKPR